MSANDLSAHHETLTTATATASDPECDPELDPAYLATAHPQLSAALQSVQPPPVPLQLRHATVAMVAQSRDQHHQREAAQRRWRSAAAMAVACAACLALAIGTTLPHSAQSPQSQSPQSVQHMSHADDPPVWAELDALDARISALRGRLPGAPPPLFPTTPPQLRSCQPRLPCLDHGLAVSATTNDTSSSLSA